jgi:O-antigen/teichoic acid export membrane protein
MSVRKRFLKNGLAAVLQKTVRILDQLLLVPFFISAWGTSFYGEWLTLMIVPTVLGFSDLGFGTAAANSFVLWHVSGNKKRANDIFSSGFFAISSIVAVGALLSFGFIYIGNNTEILSASIIPKEDAVYAVSAMMAARIFSFYQQLYEARFTAARKSHLSINANTIHSLVVLGASISILLMGHGVVVFSAVNLLISIGYTIAYAFFANKTLPLDNEYKGVIIKKDLIEIFKKGISYLMTPIWQAIFFQGTTLIVRVVLGPAAVTLFNTVRTVTRAINQFYTMIISTTLSEMQFEVGKENFSKVRKIFRVGLAVILFMALAGMGALFFFGGEVYELWTRKSLNPPELMWNIFMAGIIFNALWWPTSFIFQVMNRPRDLAVFGVFGSVVSVAVSYFLTVAYGIVGAAVGSVAMDLILCAFILPRGCRLIGQSIKTLPQDIFIDLRQLFETK